MRYMDLPTERHTYGKMAHTKGWRVVFLPMTNTMSTLCLHYVNMCQPICLPGNVSSRGELPGLDHFLERTSAIYSILLYTVASFVDYGISDDTVSFDEIAVIFLIFITESTFSMSST